MTSDEHERPLTRIRAALAGPRGYRRVDALLSATDAASEVAALSVTELYLLVREVGFADTHELVALATPEQIRGCLDLDIWDRDRLQTEAMKPWLAAVIEGGFEKLGQVWERLDNELTALFFARATTIYDLSMEEEPDDSDGCPVVLTPDSFFGVKITAPDDDSVRLVHQLVDDLYRADGSGTLARHTLMAARSEPTSELEEMSYRWRAGRLADIGYVDFYDALEVFRPLDPSSVEIGEGSEDRVGPATEGARSVGRLPVPIAERVISRSFLARALDQVHDRDDAERLESAMLVLVNKVLSAARVSPGDSEALSIGGEHALATLALGLETVSRGDVDSAALALRTVSLTRLHRVGYTVTLRLGRLARALAPRAATAAEPTPSILKALLLRRPFFPRELDTPPQDGPRPFERGDDIRRAALELTELALRIAIADALGADLVALAAQPEPRAELDDHVRTALIRALAGDAVDPAPLTEADIEALRTSAFAETSLTAAARDVAANALATALATAGVTAGVELLPSLLTRWFTQIERLFAFLPIDEPVDPRFVDGVILAVDRQ
jgi:hypothetical protein